MASRILSRFLPGADSRFHNDPQHDLETQQILERGPDSDDEDRLQGFADDQELDNMLLEGPRPNRPRQQQHKPYRDRDQDGIATETAAAAAAEEASSQPAAPSSEDDNVPASLLMEAHQPRTRPQQETRRQNASREEQTDNMRLAWKKAREHQSILAEQALPLQLPEPLPRLSQRTQPASEQALGTRIDRKEHALWRWINVENIDGFLLEVYQYYTDHGIYSIMLSRLIHILTTAFLFTAYIFLSSCIDYTKVPHSKTTPEILIPKCMSKMPIWKGGVLWLFVLWWSWSLFRYIMDIPRLWHLHDFYHHLLGIADPDMQTIAWERVVEGLMSLRASNPETAANIPGYLKRLSKTTQSKQRMDAHDIANRLMRRDNYYIALLNKEILDIQLQLPFIGPRSFYSKSLEWCLSFCFENFIFDHHGHVQPHILDVKLRLRMIETLRRRFRFAAVISIIMAPLNIGAQCIYFFSRYYAEFRNAPAQLGARAFTPYAEWKMRDFNELEHDFRRRMKMAYPFADRYLAQFPRDKTIQFLQFVSLVTGTVAAVLGVATLLDPELFLGFEITPNRTAFFYLSLSMGIFAAARNAVPDDSEVHEPILHLFEVIEYTHYAPQRWRGRFHTPAVRDEFAGLYQVKVLIFLAEIMSLVATPFILWRNAARASSSAAIIDFFRQNTVHVDGLGGLCNHAVFEFRKRTKPEDDDADHDDVVGGLRDEYFGKTRTNNPQQPRGGSAATAAIAKTSTPAATGRGRGKAATAVREDNKMAQSQYYFMQRLGRYDRSQAERLRRGLAGYGSGGIGSMHYHNNHHHYHHQHNNNNHQPPPSFPPLSPLRDATLAFPRRGTARKHRVPASTTGGGSGDADTVVQSSSPQQSLLLDLRRHSSASQHGNGNSSGGGILGDLTTSRLIDADRSLADSWKNDHDDADGDDNDDDDDDDDGAHGRGDGRHGRLTMAATTSTAVHSTTAADRDDGDKGVLGLLIEYSKAHGAPRGRRMGT